MKTVALAVAMFAPITVVFLYGLYDMRWGARKRRREFDEENERLKAAGLPRNSGILS